MKLLRQRKRKTLIIIAVVSGVIVVGFLTWLIISLITQKVELELTQTYQLPEFASLESLNDVGGEMAIAIDGGVTLEHSDIATLNTDADNSEAASWPTASTAKMILGLAIMESKPFNKGEVGETITITQEMYDRYLWYASNNGSVTQVAVGEEISEYDALAEVFLASANNMADNLAMWAFGSLENYRDYTATMLKKMDINNTLVGIDASGFDASTTSTPADLARIGQKVLQNPVLAEIVGLKEYPVPVAGTIRNTNQLLGQAGIVGIKTGYIGDVSGYCLVTGYLEGEHIITTALLQAPTRAASFDKSLALVTGTQSLVKEQKIVQTGDIVGYYNSWWTGKIAIKAETDLIGLGWSEAKTETNLTMDRQNGILKIKIGEQDYEVAVKAEGYNEEPSFGDRLGHLFGWSNNNDIITEVDDNDSDINDAAEINESEPAPINDTHVSTNAPSNNCTIKYGALMLINPNFTVENDFIAARRGELISLTTNYGIKEHNAGNGDNLLDTEAAEKINEMIKAYEADNPGHTMETLSCFRSVGTSCGRLCAATGTSDHHTGLTCDLVDPAYDVSLDTSNYDAHPDWQWLKTNSYRYGFIDRFPEAWAGGPMSEPINVDANGTTGLYETWHYRYVGVTAATEIATGKYNNGQYDSLEHYLLARGMVNDLKAGVCNV